MAAQIKMLFGGPKEPCISHVKEQFLVVRTYPGMPDDTAGSCAKMAEQIEMLFGFWTPVGRIKQLWCGLTWNYFDHLLYCMYILLHFSLVQRTVYANWTCENASVLVCMWCNNSVTREWDVYTRDTFSDRTYTVMRGMLLHVHTCNIYLLCRGRTCVCWLLLLS